MSEVSRRGRDPGFRGGRGGGRYQHGGHRGGLMGDMPPDSELKRVHPDSRNCHLDRGRPNKSIKEEGDQSAMSGTSSDRGGKPYRHQNNRTAALAMRSMDERLMEKLQNLSSSTTELTLPEPHDQNKRFTNRCRLFIGNLTDSTTTEQFNNMFKEYGQIKEPYLNADKGFGFVKFDFRENAEKARRALDNTLFNGRNLKVRYSKMDCSIKVKRLSPYVSNELLEYAFSVFGELERAMVIVDERGKSTGEGIIEFAKKSSANHCFQKCSDTNFFITESLCPVEVEIMHEDDQEDGLPERSLPKKHPEFLRERSIGPRLSVPGTFEHEYGMRWKQLYQLEHERKQKVKLEMRIEAEKLQDELDYARREHENEALREQLRARELEQQRRRSEWEQRHQMRQCEWRQCEQLVQRRQQQLHGQRIPPTDEEYKMGGFGGGGRGLLDMGVAQPTNQMFGNQGMDVAPMGDQQMWLKDMAPVNDTIAPSVILSGAVPAGSTSGDTMVTSTPSSAPLMPTPQSAAGAAGESFNMGVYGVMNNSQGSWPATQDSINGNNVSSNVSGPPIILADNMPVGGPIGSTGPQQQHAASIRSGYHTGDVKRGRWN